MAWGRFVQDHTRTGPGWPERDISAGPWRNSRPELDYSRIRHRLAPCPEIDCIRHLVHPARLAAAELRAAETRTGADRVLVTDGIVSETDYARAFALHHGIALDTLVGVPRWASPIPDDALLQALASGILPLRTRSGLIWIVAPWQYSARLLIETLRRFPNMRPKVRITTMHWLRDFVNRQADGAVGQRAAFALRDQQPNLSAGLWQSRVPLMALAASMALIGGLWTAQTILTPVIDIALALIFLGWSALRVAGILLSSAPQRPHVFRGDHALPIYSIIVAVYRSPSPFPPWSMHCAGSIIPALGSKCTKLGAFAT